MTDPQQQAPPPLPEPFGSMSVPGAFALACYGYTADQMREYAAEAVASALAEQSSAWTMERRRLEIRICGQRREIERLSVNANTSAINAAIEEGRRQALAASAPSREVPEEAYGSVEMPYEIHPQPRPEELRLLSWITRSFGNDHPAYADVEALSAPSSTSVAAEETKP